VDPRGGTLQQGPLPLDQTPGQPGSQPGSQQPQPVPQQAPQSVTPRPLSFNDEAFAKRRAPQS